MTELEKNIYNQWLIVSRAIENKPFKLRNNFDNFETNKHYPAVVKLASFFKKHNHLDIKTFFEAPYFVSDNSYHPLEYYVSMKAVNAYKKYHEKFLLDNPDTKVSLEFIKNSIVFIDKFCKEQNLSTNQYMSAEENGIPCFLVHLKEKKVSIYALFSFKGVNSYIKNVIKKHPNLIEIYFNPLYRMDYIRTKLLTSAKAKKNVNLFKKYVEREGN